MSVFFCYKYSLLCVVSLMTEVYFLRNIMTKSRYVSEKPTICYIVTPTAYFGEFMILTIFIVFNIEAYPFVDISHRSSHSCLPDRALSNQNRQLLPHCITPFRRWYHLTFLTITPIIDIIPLTRSNWSLNDNVVQTEPRWTSGWRSSQGQRSGGSPGLEVRLLAGRPEAITGPDVGRSAPPWI